MKRLTPACRRYEMSGLQDGRRQTGNNNCLCACTEDALFQAWGGPQNEGGQQDGDGGGGGDGGHHPGGIHRQQAQDAQVTAQQEILQCRAQ